MVAEKSIPFGPEYLAVTPVSFYCFGIRSGLSSSFLFQEIANALLKYETLDADDVKLILEGGKLDKPTVADLLAAEQARNNNNDKNNKTKQPETESKDSQD